MALRMLLCPPFFFAQRREWPSFVLNGCAYVVALLAIGSGLYQLSALAAGAGYATVGPAVAFWAWGLIFWLLCVAHMADSRRRARAKGGPSTRKRRLVTVVLFLANYVALFVLAQSCARGTMARPVGPEVPALFPLVVVTPGTGGETDQVRLVYYRDLPEVAQKNPGLRYLLPQGAEKRLGARLDGGTFRVERRADGVQVFEVEKTVHEEAYVVGWYEASETEVRPVRFLVFHRMAFFVVLWFPITVGSALLTWILRKLVESTRAGGRHASRGVDKRAGAA
jgi:hypothetical protein